MAKKRHSKTQTAKAQATIAVVCVSLLSVVYLAAYVQLHKVAGQLQPQKTLASVNLAPLTPPADPAPLAYAPDVALPRVSNGLAPLIYMVPTKLPVVFLTIDDGVYREPEAAARMREAHVPASLFLTNNYTHQHSLYFRDLAGQTGSVIEDHTLTHKDLPTLNYHDQHTEICATADVYAQLYGKRPTIMRPPYGDFNADTQRAAASCGLRGIIIWHALVQNGTVQYQIGNSLRPGDIVLMHFTPNFKKDLQAFIDASKAAGLTPQLLEDWFVR